MSKKNRVSNSSKKNFNINVIKGGKDAESYGLGDPCVPPEFSYFPEEKSKSKTHICLVVNSPKKN
tara:strand:- start:1383 stop:1577 length:195 start_codon:yes stop_codon:yes gene_type:complete